jgi:hypothetical protein
LVAGILDRNIRTCKVRLPRFRSVETRRLAGGLRTRRTILEEVDVVVSRLA